MAGLGDYEFQPPGETPAQGAYGRGGMLRVAVLGLVVVGLVIAAGIYFVLHRRPVPSGAPAQPAASVAQTPAAPAEDIEKIDLPPLDDSDALCLGSSAPAINAADLFVIQGKTYLSASTRTMVI